MSAENVALLITLILFAAGLISSFLPVFPGNLIVWVGILVHKIILGDNSVSWTFFWIATALAILAQILDSLCTYWGARRFGATWQGAVGGLAGAVIGAIFFNIPGLIIGPIIGVVAVELIRGSNFRQASRAGLGTIIGGLLSFLIKLVLTCLMIAGFFFSLKGWF